MIDQFTYKASVYINFYIIKLMSQQYSDHHANQLNSNSSAY